MCEGSCGPGSMRALENDQGGGDPKKLNPGTAEATCAQMPSLGATFLKRRRNGKQKQK